MCRRHLPSCAKSRHVGKRGLRDSCPLLSCFTRTTQVISLVVSWNHLKTDTIVLAKRVAPTAKHHRAIYEAIKKHDPVAARKLMRAHIGGMSKRVLKECGRR